MRYLALACDYDGTLASEGHVASETVAALKRLRDSGRALILVTGRQLDDLLPVFPQVNLFERVVAENGALLYWPANQEMQTLGDRPTDEFIQALRQRGVDPLIVGQVIVATWHPHETAVKEVIRKFGLDLQVILNKGAVMILPSALNKASGLSAALKELGLPPRYTVAVGDAENDQAFLDVCGFGVAVANALPELQKQADFVTSKDHGAGVVELIDKLVGSDLSEFPLHFQSKQSP